MAHDVEHSTTQTPLIIDYDDDPSPRPAGQFPPTRGFRVPNDRLDPYNPHGHRHHHRLPLVGKRRPAKPLQVVRRRKTPKGIVTRVGEVYHNAISWFQERRIPTQVEGPKSLRAVAFIGGVGTALTSLVAACHGATFVASVPVAALLIYQLFFGVATLTIEAKNLRLFEAIQPWLNEWFPFLSVPLGKGLFYLFTGVLGLSIWQSHVFVAAAGGFMCLIGILYICVYFGWRKHLHRVGIEYTAHPTRQQQYEDDEDDVAEQLPRFGSHRVRGHQLTGAAAVAASISRPRGAEMKEQPYRERIYLQDPGQYQRVPAVPSPAFSAPVVTRQYPVSTPPVQQPQTTSSPHAWTWASHPPVVHAASPSAHRESDTGYPIEFLDGISRYRQQQEQAAAW